MVLTTSKKHVSRLRRSSCGNLQLGDRGRSNRICPCRIIRHGNAGRFRNSHGDRATMDPVLNWSAKRSSAKNLNSRAGNETHFHESRSNAARSRDRSHNCRRPRAQIGQSHCIHKTTACSKTGETTPENGQLHSNPSILRHAIGMSQMRLNLTSLHKDIAVMPHTAISFGLIFPKFLRIVDRETRLQPRDRGRSIPWMKVVLCHRLIFV
jgi:hypothetical protein